MKRLEFLDQLRAYLEKIPSAEKTKLVEYYNELYYDRLDSGESEEDIVAGFGTPQDAAEKFLNESGIDVDANKSEAFLPDSKNVTAQIIKQEAPDGKFDKNRNQKSSKKGFDNAEDNAENKALKKPFYKNKNFWTIYLAGFVITFPLTLAVLGVAIGLLSAAFGICLGLVCGVLGICIGLAACLTAGIYGIISSVFLMTQSFPAGLAQLGVAFAAIAVGIVGVYLCTKIFPLIARLIKRRKKHGKN